MYQDSYGNGENYGMEPFSSQEGYESRKNHMALASMVLGILSIVTACCFFPGLLLGGLAVLFAALSKVDERLKGQGIAGLITGMTGILLGACAFVLWIIIGLGA